MNFNESVAYLNSLGNEVLAMKLGLESVGRLLAALGDPQKNYLKVQVVGTNGKGSTCAFLEAICLEAGVRTGLTTSPHLVSVTERVRIGGANIAEADFARFATTVREAGEKLVAAGELASAPTFFEQVTAVALLAFAEKEVDLAILETGLGGRFDATTAARAEIVAVAPVDLDHQRILGDTLAEIAAEKAAAIGESTRAAIVAPQMPEAARVVIERCRAAGVEPVFVSDRIGVKIERRGAGELPAFSIDFATENDVYHDLRLGLAGRHQAVNAALAVAVAETLREFEFSVEKPDIWRGLEKARHAGRLEMLGGVLFDGAHNAGGARALGAFLDEFVERPPVIVFGAVRDKDLTEVAAALFPAAGRLILTRADNPRSLSAAELMPFVPTDFPPENVFQTDSAADALALARRLAGPDAPILVTGSLYLVGEAQKKIKDGVSPAQQ